MADIFSKEKRSKIMSSIKGKNTTIELHLRRALWKYGIRGYRVNYRMPGKPDIVFTKQKIAVFCDGDFWHGKDFESWKKRLNPFWLEKIQKNIDRDRKIDALLEREGWILLHFWESEILDRIEDCVERINNEIRLKKIK